MQNTLALLRELIDLLKVSYEVREAKGLARDLVVSVYGETALEKPWNALPQNQHLKHRLRQRTKQVLLGAPIQYACGGAYFLSRWMKLGPGVFIPRPETEEWLGRLLTQKDFFRHKAPHILDVGTGSGCMAISIALAQPNAQVVAIDHSQIALSYAKQNAKTHHANVQWNQQSMYQLPPPTRPYTLIISNPPYVPFEDRCFVAPHILHYEPWAALFASEHDPLAFYKALARYAIQHLRPRGHLVLEVHAPLAHATRQLLAEYQFKHLKLHLDLHQRPRLLTAVAPAG